MDAANTTPSGNSGLRTVKTSKSTTSSKRIEAVRRKSVDEKRHGLEACRKKSKKIRDWSFSSKHETTITQDIMHCSSVNHSDVDLLDGNRHEEASQSFLILPHNPVTIDPNGLTGKRLIAVNQEKYDELEGKIKDVKNESAMYSGKIRYYSDLKKRMIF